MGIVVRPYDFADSYRDQGSELRRVLHDVTLRQAGPHEGWHQVGQSGEPGFQNSFVDNGLGVLAPPRFFRDPEGWVYLTGRVSRSPDVGASLTIFTLPTYYRPPYTVAFPWWNADSNNVWEVFVFTNGNVVGPPVLGGAGYVHPSQVLLDGVRFRVV